LWVNGIDPGFANDWLPLAVTGISERMDQVRCLEILDYSTYHNRKVLFDIMGFGGPLGETPLLLQPGVLSLAWGSVVRQLASGLDIELDGVEESYQRLAAPETLEIGAGEIAAARRPRSGSRCEECAAAVRSACWSTSPGCAPTSGRTGRSRRGRAATGSR
jgi:4-hydroxy-tetrahydrodipicolinate reductase